MFRKTMLSLFLVCLLIIPNGVLAETGPVELDYFNCEDPFPSSSAHALATITSFSCWADDASKGAIESSQFAIAPIDRSLAYIARVHKNPDDGYWHIASGESDSVVFHSLWESNIDYGEELYIRVLSDQEFTAYFLPPIAEHEEGKKVPCEYKLGAYDYIYRLEKLQRQPSGVSTVYTVESDGYSDAKYMYCDYNDTEIHLDNTDVPDTIDLSDKEELGEFQGYVAIGADTPITPTIISGEGEIPSFVYLPLTLKPAPPLPDIQLTCGVSNESPYQHQTVSVWSDLKNHDNGIFGVTMNTTWNYRTVTSYCSGVTNSSGRATCSRNISDATIGYEVLIDVEMTLDDTDYLCVTSFTPESRAVLHR
jgi:hypothetical protein